MNNTKNKNIIFYEKSLYMRSKYQPLLVGSFLIFSLLIPNVSLSNASNSISPINYIDSSDNMQALKNFALSKINEDRCTSMAFRHYYKVITQLPKFTQMSYYKQRLYLT